MLQTKENGNGADQSCSPPRSSSVMAAGSLRSNLTRSFRAAHASLHPQPRQDLTSR